MTAGRPSEYTQEKADVICEQLASGDSMRKVCEPDEMPAMSTVFRWLREQDEFRQQYETAKDEAADVMVEEINEIADNSTNDYVTLLADAIKEKPASEWTEEDIHVLAIKAAPEAIQRSRLRVDARKWTASKLKPKKYGDKQLIGSDPDNPLLPKDLELTIVRPKKRSDPTEA